MASSSTERIRVNLPAGFDPARHMSQLMKKIGDAHGDGFEVDSIEDGVAVATRQVAVTEVSHNIKSKTKEVRLPRSVKPTDGEKMAVKLADQHGDGWEMTKFEPFLGKAVLTQLSSETARCRGAAALALGVKPWEVQVNPRRDGGFDLELPRTYMPSKHDSKLEEVATGVVGHDGWYVKVNAQKLTASIIPSAPPTFPEGIAFPLARLGQGNIDRTPFGMVLPDPGEDSGPEISIDWTASAWALVAGTPGSGKRQPLDSSIPVPVSPRFPSGWATIGQLDIGDEVFAASGDVAKVDYLSPVIDDEVLEFEFSDGQTVRCDPGHLWTVSTRYTRHSHYPNRLAKRARTDAVRQAEFARLRAIGAEACGKSVGADTEAIARLTGLSLNTVRTFAKQAALPYLVGAGSAHARFYPVDEFIEAWIAHIDHAPANRQPLLKTVEAREIAEACRVQDGRANFAVQVAGSLILPDADLAVSPYFLGAWLGDGSSRAGAITVGADELDVIRPLLESEWAPATRDELQRDGKTLTLHFGRKNPAKCNGGHEDAWHVTAAGERYCRNCRTEPGRQYDNAPLRAHLARLGVLHNKHIPAEYLRASGAQRLALLQGLMDTDGTVDANGSCELTLCDERLATGALELIRSLGIKASMRPSDASITSTDSDGIKTRRIVGTRYRICFTTTTPVFRMPRKLARQSASVRATQDWIYITAVRSVGRAPGRCIRINHPSHIYLTAGFIPTHNTVTLNAVIADALSNGSALAVVDDVSKAIDFEWARSFCRPGGWGCDSLEASVGTLGLIREEGARRSKILKEMGISNWLDMPAGKRFQPILVIVDEVSALVVPDPVPKGIPKDHPLFLEIGERNLARAMIQSYMRKIIAELRFVGVRMVISTQATNANTGVDPGLRTLIGHKILQGVNPSKAARSQIFADESAVLNVPENVKSGGKRAKGVGVAALEADAPAVYKSYFATTDDYQKTLRRLGIKESSDVEPSSREINKFLPALGDASEATAARREKMADPMAAMMGDSGLDENGRPLKGAALAAAQTRQLSNMAGRA